MPLFLDVFRRPKGNGLDGQRGIKACVGDQNASISYEQVVDVVTLAVPAYDGSFRIVAHPASAVLMISHATFAIATTPGLDGSGLF
jgi:hypothetical protein